MAGRYPGFAPNYWGDDRQCHGPAGRRRSPTDEIRGAICPPFPFNGDG